MAKTNNNPHSVLYYPSIEFQSVEWVKKALLYWDHVYRIVPKDYSPSDSEEIVALKSEGLVRDIPVSQGEKEKSAESFLKFFRNLEYTPSGLNDSNYDRLNLEKVDARLYPLLDRIAKESGLESNGNWINMPPNFVRGYMFFLSQIVAESRMLSRATDNLDAWSIAPYFTERGNFPFEDVPFKEENKGLYCSLMIEDILPINVGSIPVKDIVDFNQNRQDERQLLRDCISELVHRLPQIKNIEQWNDEIQFKIDEIEKAKDDFRKSQNFWASGMPASIFGIGVPTCITALFSGEYTVKRLATSIILGAMATITDYSKIKLNRNPSYASYLVGIDNIADSQQYRSINISGYANSVMHEFLND